MQKCSKSLLTSKCTTCSSPPQSVLPKHLQIFKSNCSLEVKLNQVRASREVRFSRILECSWVKEKSFLIADSLVISKCQTSLEWFSLIITFAFIWLAKRLTKSYFIQAPILFLPKGFCNLWEEKRLKLLSTIICYSLTTCLFETAIAWWNAGYIHSLP